MIKRRITCREEAVCMCGQSFVVAACMCRQLLIFLLEVMQPFKHFKTLTKGTPVSCLADGEITEECTNQSCFQQKYKRLSACALCL